MLKIEGKTFMNIQEAVQWLLENNALPFQSTANYSANTEIGLGTIVNPSPAKVRIGSLIFFADSKVSTVVGITETGFICSDKYNNLVDDIAYVTGVTINASGHLITTLSDGQTIDAGIIKQVTDFSINASQHLIVSFNDGTSTDLGAIFNGNINISGNLTVTGGISGSAITGDSITENMSGYSIERTGSALNNWTPIFVGSVKNGNKLTFVIFGTYNSTSTPANQALLNFNIPASVGNKLYPYTLGADDDVLDTKVVNFFSGLNTYKSAIIEVEKANNTKLAVVLRPIDLEANTTYYFRAEVTFLLSENLAS